jgi:hypothetical protein
MNRAILWIIGYCAGSAAAARDRLPSCGYPLLQPMRARRPRIGYPYMVRMAE